MGSLEATSGIYLQNKKQPYIVTLTANAITENGEIGLRFGMDVYWYKPMRSEQIVTVLKRGFEYLKVKNRYITLKAVLLLTGIFLGKKLQED